MDLGKYQLVISVSVILAAAIVALLFDYLKRNNEQLRQANREMKARRSQEVRQMRLRQDAAVQAGSRARAAEPSAPVARKSASEVAAAIAQAPILGQAPILKSEAEVIAKPIPEPTPKMEIRVTALETPKKPAPVEAAAPATNARRDWSSLLKTARPEDRPEPSLAEQAMDAKAASSDLSLPVGFVSEARLTQLLQQNSRVTGMAVSIGASFAAVTMPEAIPSFVKSLLEPSDFGARRDSNEFFLILNGELGMALQRRLNNIAQRLWEFQIEGLESLGASFSWGGVEVHEIPLEEALNSASERMVETKRNRKVLPIEMRERRSELRRAV